MYVTSNLNAHRVYNIVHCERPISREDYNENHFLLPAAELVKFHIYARYNHFYGYFYYNFSQTYQLKLPILMVGYFNYNNW